jgi:ABC-type polysaccharide/polyol phosphate transport system ATPase subunit
MSENAIVVENLSKRYLIGHRLSSGVKYNYATLRDVVGREISNFARKAADFVRGHQMVQGDEVEQFWALRDVSFEVKQGEVFGIIGRNGAGKSTLLKILSRITEPTQGRVLLRRQVASLLEVGTGFHPELTGRENIFLNGAILGMTQREIRKKFDEIVAFAEVEKFLDTPVKHYSSGMYVRLAFAVAAHLDPEILIVDEVLAVGDAEFQKKCLGKMDEVSRGQGRTVLFVSHNMAAVLKLCSRGILLENGAIRTIGDIKAVVPAYLHSQSSSPGVVDLSSKPRPDHYPGKAPFPAKARIVKGSPSDAGSGWSIPFGQRLSLDLSIDVQSSLNQIQVFIALSSTRGFEVASWSNKCNNVQLPVHSGINTFRIGFEHLCLLPGGYFLAIALCSVRGFEDYVPEAVQFEIVASPEAAKIDADILGGVFVLSATVSILD